MNQNIDQNNNEIQSPKKDNTLKIALIILGAIFGIGIIGIVGFLFLFYTIFNKSMEFIDETKEEIHEKWEDNSETESDDNNASSSENNDNTSEELIEEYSNIDKISFATLKELINNKKTFVIVISQTYCSHCIEYKPTFNEVLKENDMTGLELDLLTLKKSEYPEFNDLLEVTGTPTTLIYIDGVVQKETLEGAVTKEKLSTYLKKYGFIK